MFTMDDIIDTQEILPPRIFLYSPHGFGKTLFGATSKNPIFALTEDGLGNLKKVKRFPPIDSFEKMIGAVDFLFGDHDRKTFVIDTADWLEPLIWKAVCREHDGKTTIEDFDYGKGFSFAVDKWTMLLDGLTQLRNQRGMSIIILAHSEIKRFDSPEVEPFDRYQPKLHKKASEKVQEWADIVLFGNYKTTVQSVDVGFKKEVKRGEGTGQRVLYTEERPAYYAKNRYQLPHEIPFPKTGAFDMIADWILKGGDAGQEEAAEAQAAEGQAAA